MVASTDNRQTQRQDGILLAIPSGIDIVYRGTLVCLNTAGYLVAGQDTADFRFAGVALEKKDNSAGANGDLSVRVERSGLFRFAASGMAITDVGKRAYISDDQTVTLTPGHVFCGVIALFESATVVWIDIGPAAQAGMGDKLAASGGLHTAVGNLFFHIFTCPANRKATVLAAKLVALVKPDYATDEVFNLYKYDLSGTSEKQLLATANFDIDSLTAKQATDLTLTATVADLDMDPGDALYGAANCTGTETTAGDIGVTAEIALS